MVLFLVANPQPLIGLSVVIMLLLSFLYFYPMPIPCLPCCEPNCSMKGTFTYCLPGTGPETTMCPAIRQTTKIFKKVYNGIMAFIGVLETIVGKIFKIVVKLFNVILKVINTIAEFAGVALGVITFDLDVLIPSCKIPIKGWDPDPCKAIKSVISGIGKIFKTVLDKVLKPAIEKIGEFIPKIKEALAPVIDLIFKIFGFVIEPMIEFIKNLINLMYNLIVFLKNLFFADFGKYMYWKTMWKVQSLVPFVPVYYVPFVIALFITLQISGGMMGILKLISVPYNVSNALVKM